MTDLCQIIYVRSDALDRSRCITRQIKESDAPRGGDQIMNWARDHLKDSGINPPEDLRFMTSAEVMAFDQKQSQKNDALREFDRA